MPSALSDFSLIKKDESSDSRSGGMQLHGPDWHPFVRELMAIDATPRSEFIQPITDVSFAAEFFGLTSGSQTSKGNK